MIVTLEEAEDLIPMQRDSRRPMTHLATYAAPITRRMLHFNQLGYYAIPSTSSDSQAPQWLTDEIGLFAGRLYFEFEEHESIMKLLGIRRTDDPLTGGASPTETSSTHVTGQESRHQNFQLSTSTANTLMFIQEWLGVRRKGQEFTNTPMGYMCEEKPLTTQHPFFAKLSGEHMPEDLIELPENTIQFEAGKPQVSNVNDSDGSETSSIACDTDLE